MIAHALRALVSVVCAMMLIASGTPSALTAEPADGGWQLQPASALTTPPLPDRWAAVTGFDGPQALVARQHAALLPDPGKLDHVWYRKTFAVPAAAAGHGVWLRCAQIEGQAYVVVAGHVLGEVSRLVPALDLSAVAMAGQPLTVDILVTRNPAALGLPVHADAVLDNISAWLKQTLRPALGLVGEPRLELRGQVVWLERPIITTRVSAGRVEVTAEVGGTSAGMMATARILPVTSANESAVLLASAPVSDGRITLAGAFAGTPWRLDAPHLYVLELTLQDQSGREIDRQLLRFGLREVTVVGRDVLLNGRPTRWRMMGPITSSPVTGWPSVSDFAPDKPIGRFWSALGANLWQIQPNGDFWWQNLPHGGGMPTWMCVDEAILERCDEAGIGVTLPIPPMAGNSGLILPIANDEALRGAYRREVATYLARYRHHPCIQAYTLGMNLLDTSSYMLNISPQGMGRRLDSVEANARRRDAIAAAVALVHEVDPTVPAYVHAGGWWGGDLHGANQHMNLLPLAEYERWPEAWSTVGAAPWVADEAGTPILGDFIYRRYAVEGGFANKDPELAITETCAELLGDDAYRMETAQLRRDPRQGFGHLEQYGTTHLLAPERQARHPALEAVLANYYREVLRHWRAWGIQGMVPWQMEWSFAWQQPIITDRVAAAYASANQRFLAFLGGPGDEFWRHTAQVVAGQPVERSLVLLYDGPATDTAVEAGWQVLDPEQHVVAAGTYSDRLAAGPRHLVPLRFSLPTVTQRTVFRLRLTAHADGVEQSDEATLIAWPAAMPIAPLAARVIDPSGDGLGEWREHLRADPQAPVVVIARHALGALSALPFTAADIAAGTRVLIIEQTAEDLQRLGLRCEERGFRQAFIREAAALPGIGDADLAEWAGDATLLPETALPGYWSHRLIMLGTKAQRPGRCGTHGTLCSVAIETPQRGAFRPLVVAGFDEAYAPLLEWRHGLGSVLFCQLDVTARSASDPVAERVRRCLLERLRAAPTTPAADRPLNFTTQDPAAQALAALGFALGDGEHSLVVAPLGTDAPDLAYALPGASAAGWQAAQLDAAPQLVPLALPGITVGPGALRFRLPLSSLTTADGGFITATAGRIACGISPLAADKGPATTARLTAQCLRGLYQTLLTGLGAQSSAAMAQRLTTLAPPLAPPGAEHNDFIALEQVQVTSPETAAGRSGAALLAAWPQTAWQDLAPLLARRDAAGYGGESGTAAGPVTVDLRAAFGGQAAPERRAGIRASFTLPAAVTMNLYAGADYWAEVLIDGAPALDLSNQHGAPQRPAASVALPLAAGLHRIEVHLVSGSNGFSCFLAADTRATPRGKADFIPDIGRYGRWLLPSNPTGSAQLYLTPRGDDNDPYLYYLW